jgi:2'-5' RNA ligase
MNQENFSGLISMIDKWKRKGEHALLFQNFEPALEFGKKIGLEVHQKWNPPLGIDWDRVQSLLRLANDGEGEEIIKELWERTIKTNPEVAKYPSDLHDKYTIMQGMASEFNIDDIIEFLTLPFYKRDDKYKRRLARIERIAGIPSQWVPSEKTLRKMEDHLRVDEEIIHLKNFDEFINEGNKKETYDYGCVMLYFKFTDLKTIQKKIDKKDLYKKGNKYGFETEPHVTLLYGLHSEEIADKKVLDSVKDVKYGKLKLHNISMFDNPDYDVLKFDVSGAGLSSANRKLKEFPYTSDYPKFHAHSTIAYLKKGKAKEYIEKFKDEEFKISPSHLVYSKPDGTKRRAKI